MKTIITLFLILLIHVVAQAQPKTKQVLIEGNGPPVVLLHGGTCDMNSFATHSKIMADSFKVIRMEQFNVQYANEGDTLVIFPGARTTALFCDLDNLN